MGEGDGVEGVIAVQVSEPSRAPEPHAPNPPRYWFPAKTYGWGWGLPSTWEGWLGLMAYLGLMVGAAKLCPPEKSVVGFVAAVCGLSAGLVAICWWKGEPVRWRWGCCSVFTAYLFSYQLQMSACKHCRGNAKIKDVSAIDALSDSLRGTASTMRGLANSC